jgi:uncharacterized phage protein (TIGR01671 family)
MRNFRFRAWDAEKKVMVITGFHIIGETTAFDLLNQYSIKDFDNLVISQATGVNDKNGKEIYEFDIVKFNPCGAADERYGTRIGVIQWNNNSALFAAVVYDSFQAQTVRGEESLFKASERFIVLGNVFENPKLVE